MPHIRKQLKQRSIAFLISALSRLPLPVLYMLSSLLFLIFYHLIRFQRRLLTENLRRIFPDQSPAERNRLAATCYRNALDFLFESLKSWRLDKDMGGGGAIMDLGVYCIQAARRFTGELPQLATAQGYNTDPSVFQGIYESVFLQLQFPSGAICNVSTSYNAYVDRFHAACEKGWLELKPSFNAGQPVQINGAREIAATKPISTFQQVYRQQKLLSSIRPSPDRKSKKHGLSNTRHR